MANKTLQGKIGVTTENIFPVIKQFLYSDHEIFLRELVANAVDASQKLKALSSNGETDCETSGLKVEIELDEKKKILRVIDHGIGMTQEEVDRYINQIAFSSAGEFLEKYKEQMASIIGHFGLGFYSAFMVAEKVTIETLSWKEGAKAVKWTCDGSPEYSIQECKKEDRGTVITLHLDKDSEEFASKGRISQLLGKYCKFMPVPVVFGKKTEWKDGKNVETEEDNVINSIEPLWAKSATELKDEDYLKFYKDLYPLEEEPMFWIHLNVDYPFNLTGILYFPKIKERMDISKSKIQLFCNQMFVTDHVDNIVPDFLTLLHGVIDSPDIPLNVSRSYLQADSNVKKISTYITKKVADRLEEIFKEQRQAYEEKWDNIKLFIEYGMLSDEKFCERAMDFALLKNTDGKFFSIGDYRKAIEGSQSDKDKKVVFLYATDTQEQYGFIEAAKNRGYDVLLMDCELDSHFVNLLETKVKDCRFARVDSDTLDNLIAKEERVKPEMSDEDKKTLEELFKGVLPGGNEYMVEPENLGETAEPVVITQSEFMRRYREMSAMGGGMNFYGELPQSYNIKVNMENPLIARIWGDREGSRELLCQVVDLALLGNGMLKGKALHDFIERSRALLENK
ncbi:MAG: molecular chaperone HtpG [Bacteroidales bacterium]|nr:molecular chaperone HtpG [Candidatus Cryptobacteroides fimicaballi]